MTESLTGDPMMDRLVPVAMLLVGALRRMDGAAVGEVFELARALVPDGVSADAALTVLLAAMVPWDKSPRELLAWWVRRAEYEKLVAAGVDPATAMTLIEGGAQWSTGNSGNDAPGGHGVR